MTEYIGLCQKSLPFDVDKLKVDIKNDIEVLSEIGIIINKQGIEDDDDKFDQLVKLIEKNNS